MLNIQELERQIEECDAHLKKVDAIIEKSPGNQDAHILSLTITSILNTKRALKDLQEQINELSKKRFHEVY